MFNKDGDSIVSHSTRSLGNAVKDACDAISTDWPTRAEKNPAASPAVQPVAAVAKSVETSSASKISVSSIPANADIEIDGNFVGNTPSLIEVTPGEHSVVVQENWLHELGTQA